MALGPNLVAGFLGNAWVALVQVAFVPAYIALLGLEAFGLVGVYAFLQACLALLDLGLTTALGREIARMRAGAAAPDDVRRLLRTVEILFGSMALAVVAGTAAAAPWIAGRWLRVDAIPVPVVVHALALMAALAVARWIAGLHRNAIAAHEHLVWLNAVLAVFATLRAAGVVAFLLVAGPGIEAFFAYQLVVSLVELAVLARKAWSLMPAGISPGFAPAALRGVGRLSAGLATVSALYLLLTQADKVLLSALVPLSTFGTYSLAASVAGALQLLVASVGQVAFARLNRVAAAQAGAGRAGAVHGFAQLMTLAVAPAALVLALFAEPILSLWTGDARLAEATAPLLSLLALGTALNGVMSVPCMLAVACGRSRALVALNAVLLAAFVPALYLGISSHGAVAAAWAWLGVNAAGVLMALGLLHAYLPAPEKWRWLACDVALPLVASAAAAGLVRWTGPAPEALAVALAFGCALAAGTAASPAARVLLRGSSRSAPAPAEEAREA